MLSNYIVYIKVDSNNKVIEINSSAFLSDITGYIKIDEGFGDKYHHAQNNYLDSPLMNIDGTHNYKWYYKNVVPTTLEEKQKELSTFVKPVSEIEKLQAQIDDILITLVGGAV